MAMINMSRVFPSITYAKSVKDALKDADACLIMTEWPEFSKLSEEFSLMKQPPVILEGRRMIRRPDVEGICWEHVHTTSRKVVIPAAGLGPVSCR